MAVAYISPPYQARKQSRAAQDAELLYEASLVVIAFDRAVYSAVWFYKSPMFIAYVKEISAIVTKNSCIDYYKQNRHYTISMSAMKHFI